MSEAQIPSETHRPNLYRTIREMFASMGPRPLGPRLERIKASQQYSGAKSKFINVVPDSTKLEVTFSGFIKQLLFGERTDFFPAHPLPTVRPDFADFLVSSEHLKFIWLGHSTFLLHLNHKTLLIDPVFNNAGPLPFIGRRFQAPVIEPSALPPIDIILISHDHYDHLDMKTIQFFQDKKSIFLTTLGIGAYLEQWGIASGRITELDWWDRKNVDGITFTCTPVHFSVPKQRDAWWQGKA